MARKTTAKGGQAKKETEYFEDEIDLTPYINRLMARKWWVAVIVVIAAGLAYGVSYFLPKRYQVNASLTFSGGEIISQVDSVSTAAEIVSPLYVTEMAGKFESSLREEGNAEGLISMSAEGKAYPLSVKFVVEENVDENLYHNSFLSYLNTNSYVATELEAERASVADSISDYEDSIASLDSEITRVEKIMDATSGSNADLVSSYADLISVRSGFVKEKLDLEKHLAKLQGFKFAVRPYFINGGAPTFPKKTQNAAIAGFLMLILAGGVAAFRKDSKSR